MEWEEVQYVNFYYNLGDSPRIAVHNQKDSYSGSNQKKPEENKNVPPRVPRPPQNPNSQQQQGNLNYKLPPRPGTRQQSGASYNNQKVNQSY